MNDLIVGQLLTLEEVEHRYPNLTHVATVGTGEWADELYLINEIDTYIQKGPYGSHDGICFEVCGKMSPTDIETWIAKAKAFWVHDSKAELNGDDK